MKRKIANELLKLHQTRSLQKPSPFSHLLSARSYELVTDMITDVKRPFLDVCIHGRNPQNLIPALTSHNSRFGANRFNVTLVDYIRNPTSEALIYPGSVVKEMRYIPGSDSWIPEENCFDLLVSSLQTHHANDQQDLFCKYLRSLKPDGALVGSTFVEGTLKQLYWTYLLAENQRYGGVSPKVLTFPGLGETGSHLTSAKYHLITILQEEETFAFQSFVDLLTELQEMGESGYLRGRRKGVYKDLLLSAAALYHSEWEKDEKVSASFAMSKFIAWKYHENQPKKLKPGPQVGSIEFSDQLRKFGDEVETYEIDENSQDPKRVK